MRRRRSVERGGVTAKRWRTAVSIPYSPRARNAHERRQQERYPIPNILRSWEDLLKAQHRDLPDLDTPLLVREHYRCRHRLMYEDGPAPWLEGRLLAIEEELAARRTRPPVAPPAKPRRRGTVRLG
jgi:hypothetical protein